MEILPRQFVEKPWGQSHLPEAFDAPQGTIGEVWFDRAGDPLPLLCKWLFTSEKLSVQVHPSDNEAAARGLPSGKEECWFVTDAEPDARLGIGMTGDFSAEELRAASLSGEIELMLDWKKVAPGDWFYIPAGTVHAIGAGVQLVEIQQNADITYRLYDYGRPRELHLHDGMAVARGAKYVGECGRSRKDAGLKQIVQSAKFTLWRASGPCDLSALNGRDCYFVPIAGQMACGNSAIGAGEVGFGRIDELAPLRAAADILIAHQ